MHDPPHRQLRYRQQSQQGQPKTYNWKRPKQRRINHYGRSGFWSAKGPFQAEVAASGSLLFQEHCQLVGKRSTRLAHGSDGVESDLALRPGGGA